MKPLKFFDLGKINFSIARYDLWIGAYIDTDKKKLYLCPLPCCLFTIKF